MDLAAVLYRKRRDGGDWSRLTRLSPSELNVMLVGARMVKESRVKRASVVLVGDEIDRNLIAYCRAYGFSDAICVDASALSNRTSSWGVAEVISAVQFLGAGLTLIPQYPQGLNVIDPSPVASSILGYEYIANVSTLSVESNQIHITQKLASSEIILVSKRQTFAAMTPNSSELRPKVSDEIAARAMEVALVTTSIGDAISVPVEITSVEKYIRPSIRSIPVAQSASVRRDQLMEGAPKRSKVVTAIDPKDGASLILEKIDEIRR
ncbi:MAG: hypothetical protein M0Z45_07390 [Actinomycetota bacterium]|nr:hypothetical protein [Actinomycetota bacterium]